MTLTFNPEKYKDLLIQHQPKLIQTEAENDRALAVVEELMHKRDRSPEEDALYHLLIALIEKFEQSQYAPQPTSPQSMLRFLLEQRQLEPSDLLDILGATTTDILTGNLPITPHQAELLGKFFQVAPELFRGDSLVSI
jgi:HTH-type transcriptional regulator / antitoxin HigA